MSRTDASNPGGIYIADHHPSSQDEDSNNSDSDEEEFTYTNGDYSTQVEDLIGAGGDSEEDDDGDEDDAEEEEDDEGFTYEGVDADASVSIKDQIRDVLGEDHEESEEEDASGSAKSAAEVERSLVYDNGENYSHPEDEPLRHVIDHDQEYEASSRAISPNSPISSSDGKAYPFKFSRPFLHPTVSRLRSFTPQSSTAFSNDSSALSHSRFFDGASPPPSHFSSISRMSSSENIRGLSSAKETENSPQPSPQGQDVFKWTDLQAVTQSLHSKASQKASSVLGAPILGVPTVMAANGLICIGTTEGKIVAYDFNQTLVCVCDNSTLNANVGAVTALALSHDHTCVASGHSTGYIQLFNLKQPRNPVRIVAPTTLSAVSSGRKEGHLQGSRIVSIGFIAGRHSAIVSADEHGLAFFHSLGKVLFVEASDILRILGRYPDASCHDGGSLRTPLVSSSVPAFSPTVATETPSKRGRYTVLSMAPLPLGTAPHPTDAYNVVALLTPTKLVVIGLKPTPRTWFKCPRDIDEGGSWRSRSKWIGALSWFPSFTSSSSAPASASRNGKTEIPTSPILAFSWGSSLHLLKVFEARVSVKSSKTSKQSEIEIGTVAYEKIGKWTASEDILALQWLNHLQIVVVTHAHLGVYDLNLGGLLEQVVFNGLTLASPDVEHDLVAHSLRTYKGKLFLLKRDRFQVGTLLTWADRILAFVEVGDFLKAIELARSYYTDEAPGNRNNLPADPSQRKQVIAEKLKGLMIASAQYAFSEDRMTDNTHFTPDGRGVDRTDLFVGIVAVCCRASVALDDFDFLFEDLFQKFEDSGISSIYLEQLEPFVLDNSIRFVPPRITQRLVALHEQQQRPELVERIIWHIDPFCLDLNQSIQICQRYHLYDALIYIYTRAMRDYVAPVVELLGLIRKARHFRKSREEVRSRTGSVLDADASMESIIMNAYKIFPYLANVLSGLSYPSEEALSEEEAFLAKKDIYTFLFFGRSSVWPPGEGGTLVLTSDEEGGVEPTYPYARQLLSFDSESFLHSLDIAFEDPYLNDDHRGPQAISRLMIVRIILEIMSTGSFPQEDITMINIFIARNVPKYRQFLFDQLPPSSLHNILTGLADDPDHNTREDRQLAAEFLLSVYNTHDSAEILALFERAGFYRILRTWHFQDRRWAQLLSAYIDDPDITSLDLLTKIDDVIALASKSNKGTIPTDLVSVVSDALPRLLHANIPATAYLIDKLIPNLHDDALQSFDDSDRGRYEYLQTLVTPHEIQDEGGLQALPPGPSKNLSPKQRDLFFSLQCRFHPEIVLSTLKDIPKDAINLEDIVEICESEKVYDAVVWATNLLDDPSSALLKADTFQRQIILQVVAAFSTNFEPINASEHLASVSSLARVCIDICMERSQASSATVPLEDMWFRLLNSQICAVQIISSSIGSHEMTNNKKLGIEDMESFLSSLRSLVQITFSALVSITSTSAISFPSLFKRLVNSTPSSTESHYTEFRMILTGMLESYQSDQELLNMTKHLVERDLFDAIALNTKQRSCGWVASRGICHHCHRPLGIPQSEKTAITATAKQGSPPHYEIIVSRTGYVSHLHCRPPEIVSSV